MIFYFIILVCINKLLCSDADEFYILVVGWIYFFWIYEGGRKEKIIIILNVNFSFHFFFHLAQMRWSACIEISSNIIIIYFFYLQPRVIGCLNAMRLWNDKQPRNWEWFLFSGNASHLFFHGMIFYCRLCCYSYNEMDGRMCVLNF